MSISRLVEDFIFFTREFTLKRPNCQFRFFIILILSTHLLYATGDILANSLHLYSNPTGNAILTQIHAEVLGTVSLYISSHGISAYQLVMLTFCLIERTVATVCRTVYEHSLLFSIPVLAQVIAVGPIFVFRSVDSGDRRSATVPSSTDSHLSSSNHRAYLIDHCKVYLYA